MVLRVPRNVSIAAEPSRHRVGMCMFVFVLSLAILLLPVDGLSMGKCHGARRKGMRHAMGAIAKRRPWQKDALEPGHGAHRKRQSLPEQNPFRAARRFTMLNHHGPS